MSEFKFSCPHCGQHLQCDELSSGLTIKCPSCQADITVPPAPRAATASESRRVPLPKEGGISSKLVLAGLIAALVVVAGASALIMIGLRGKKNPITPGPLTSVQQAKDEDPKVQTNSIEEESNPQGAALAGHVAEFDLGTHGVLSVAVPEGWKANGQPASTPNGSQIGCAFAFKPTNDANAKCMLTFAYVTNGEPDKEVIRKEVLRICEPFIAVSVEKRKDLKEFSLAKGYGAYCVFTDASLVGKKATPGDYKVMGSGQVQPSENMLGVVSLFADDADSPEFKAMVEIINSLRVTPKAAITASVAPSKDETLQVSESKGEFTVFLPASNLTLRIPKKGLSQGRNVQQGLVSHPRYFLFEDRPAGIMVSGWFEPQARFKGVKQVWEGETNQWSQRGLRPPENVAFQKVQGWDAVIYDLSMPPVSNTHIRADWVQAGTWIDLHLSVTSERPIGECRKQIMALLKSVRVTERK